MITVSYLRESENVEILFSPSHREKLGVYFSLPSLRLPPKPPPIGFTRCIDPMFPSLSALRPMLP